MRSVYIKTYGCQMNVYDSVKMRDLMCVHQFKHVDDIYVADVAIMNTCHVREKAEEKIYSELGRWSKIKHNKILRGDNMIIIVAGCVSQASGDAIFDRAPYVDIVVGPQSYHHIPNMIADAYNTQRKSMNLLAKGDEKFDALVDDTGSQGCSAFLSIQEGCNKFCYYCSVPQTRGPEYSRPHHDIIREATRMVNFGAREITLLGQNVSSYCYIDDLNNTIKLSNLIQSLAKIPRLQRIRYMTSHPRDMNDDLLFELHEHEPKLMPYVYLPIQSGSNRILEAMNRKYSVEMYFDVVERFRALSSNIEFSSDFIVGYPGETDEDFADTLDIATRMKFTQAYSFKYSPRKKTLASTMRNQIPDHIKTERLQILQKLLYEHQTEFNYSKIGKSIEVMIDGVGRKDMQVVGKSPWMQTVVMQIIPDIEHNAIVGLNEINLRGGDVNCMEAMDMTKKIFNKKISNMIGSIIGVVISEATMNTLRASVKLSHC